MQSIMCRIRAAEVKSLLLSMFSSAKWSGTGLTATPGLHLVDGGHAKSARQHYR